MSLASTLGAMHDLIVGRTTAEEGAARLGLASGSLDAARLGIHRRAYVHCVLDNASVTFPVTHQVIAAIAGEAAWVDLIAELGTETPMTETRFGTAALVALLAGPRAEALGLPAWISELADLELSERQVLFAPDAGQAQALSVADPLLIRSYRFDVLAVRSAEDPLAFVPEQRKTAVAIWRTRDGKRRSRSLRALGLAVLHAASVNGEAGLAELIAASDKPDAMRATARQFLDGELLQGEPSPQLFEPAIPQATSDERSGT